MCKRALIMVLLLAPSISCTVWGKSGSGWSGATGGEQLERLFWQDVINKEWTAIDRHVASSFVGIGPDGTMNKQAFLQHLRESSLNSFSLSDCQVQLNGADTVVSCVMRAQTASAQAAQASTLSVWQQVKKGWVMVAHAEATR